MNEEKTKKLLEGLKEDDTPRLTISFPEGHAPMYDFVTPEKMKPAVLERALMRALPELNKLMIQKRIDNVRNLSKSEKEQEDA